ncbi:hypothetical protein WME73_47060 [Sorangium sp. So ce302]|uniref:hypothetical protein n=1 Tax=unclassified Sorangium TaxID=2621164 RepID=UPI003F603D38
MDVDRRGESDGLCNRCRRWEPIHYPLRAFDIPIFGPLTWRMDSGRWQGSTSTIPGGSKVHGLGERLLSPTGFGIFPWQTDAV